MNKVNKVKKKNDKNKLYGIIAIIVIVIVLIPIFVYISINSSNKEIEDEFDKEGYQTSKEDAFYRKVTTNNTLDDYYNDIASGTSSEYQEYYYSKQSNDFIELKMVYKNKVNTSLSITTNLETDELLYNYELTYKTAHLILEGTSKDNYNCNVIVNNQVQEDTVKKYCDLIIDEINEYNVVKEDLLKNQKIRDLSKENSWQIKEK